MTDSASAKSTSSRKPLFAVMALFFAPLLLAFAVYYGSDWRPAGTTNKGELITPVIPLPAVALQQLNGTATDVHFLRNSWTLVYLGVGDCAAACRGVLTNIGSIRLMLGKDASRVRRAFLYAGDCCTTPAYFSNQSDLISASLADAAGQTLLAAFPAHNQLQTRQAGHIYIVDPLGNLLMSYAADVNPRAIYQDLKKLLDLSHIG